MFEFVERAAPFFGDIRREFDAIQAEVRPVEQTQFFAHQENIAEESLDLALHRGDKLSNRAVVRGIAIREGNEENVFLTCPLDTCTARKCRCLAGTDHPSGISQQDHLEQDLGMDGGCARLIVVVARIKDG